MRRGLEIATAGWAALGGVALLLAAIAVTASVLGRYFFRQPLVGDYELLEIATLWAASASLPWGQWHQAPSRLGALAVTLVAAVMTWRVAVGAIDAVQRGGYSMLWQIPDSTAYLLALPGLGLLVAVGLCQLVSSRG